MSTPALPSTAAWRHSESRDGFETVFFAERPDGWLLQGQTCAVEDGHAWAVRYDVIIDSRWRSRTAHVWSWSVAGAHETVLESDGDGHWHVDGARAAHLDGCLDVDLESSACTNTLPVHRLGLAVGEEADAPAVYVRAPRLEVARLDQTYRRIDDGDSLRRYHYRSPAFDFAAVLTFDGSGLVVDYPGIATRVL